MTVNENLPDGPWVVTGAAGFIGFHVCQRLLQAGQRVVGLDAMSSYYDPALKRGRLSVLEQHRDFAFHQMDCANDQAVALLFSQLRPRQVIHLAAQAGVRYSMDHPQAYLHSNLTGFGSVLEAARRTEVDHLVYASSSSVYGSTSKMPFDVHNPADHPVSLYAATKRANELMAHSYSHLFDLPTTGLRFFTVYGPWGRPDMAYYAFAKAILNRRPLTLFGDGSVVRDFTYIDDIVDGVLGVTAHAPQGDPAWSSDAPDPATSIAPYRLFNIGHGGQATVTELIEMLADIIGEDPIIERQAAAPGDVPRTWADTTDLTTVTGQTPTIDLRDGLTRFVDWLREREGTATA